MGAADQVADAELRMTVQVHVDGRVVQGRLTDGTITYSLFRIAETAAPGPR